MMVWVFRITFVTLLKLILLASAAAAPGTELHYEAMKAREFSEAGNPDFDYRLGLAAIVAKRPVDAVLALLRALTLRPDFLPARAALGRAYAMLGAYAAAQREIRFVLAAEAVPAEARAQLSRDLAAIEGAMKRRQAALDAARADQEYRRGITALDAGNIEDAIAVFENLLSQFPEHVPARAELGRAYARNGQYAAARRELSSVAGGDDLPDEVREVIVRRQMNWVQLSFETREDLISFSV